MAAELKGMILIAMAACLLTVMIPFVNAQEQTGTTESFIVYTDKQSYEVGETINIFVKALSIDPGSDITVQNVTVYGPDDSVVADWRGLNLVLTDTENPQQIGSVTATMEGTCSIEASGFGCPWVIKWIWTFFCWRRPPQAVPEAPLGTAAIAIAMVGAAGVYVKKRKSKDKE